jgi:hypothetical protein
VLDFTTSQENIMELELYSALQEVGISEIKAKAVVESVNKAIDQRYNLHSKQLATQGDIEKVRAEIANAKAEIIKWNVGTMFAAIGIFVTLMKLIG